MGACLSEQKKFCFVIQKIHTFTRPHTHHSLEPTSQSFLIYNHSYMKRFLVSTLLVFSFAAAGFAQSGTLKGQITDKNKKEGLPFVNVVVELNGSLIAGGTTDFDGNFVIKPIPPGKYNVKASSVGYAPIELQGIVITSDAIRLQNIAMTSTDQELPEVEIIEIAGPPLIEAGKTTAGSTMTRDDVAHSVNRGVREIAAGTAGVNQRDEGKGLNIKGAREGSTYYYVDGVKVRGSTMFLNQALSRWT